MSEAWQTVSKHEVLKAYKRPEVQASTQYLVPAKWNIEQVCRTNVRRTDAKTPEQEADFEFLRRVTGNQTWPAFTPETEQRLFCNHALLVHVHQLGSKWDLEKAWISGLVQSGSLLRWQGQPHFVLRAYEQGLLLWPMQDTGDSRLAFQKVLDKLVWGFLFDVESPMIGLRSQRAGIQVVAGAWEPLLKNVLDRGCAGLSESQLKKLNGLLGNDEPEANQPDQEIALAVHILINQDPTLSEQEVLNRIHIKTADEELPVEGMTEEMAQVLRDTIRPEDQQKIMKTLSEKNKPPPVKVAELAKKCYQQSYKKIPAKKVQEAVKRKKKAEAAQPRGTTSKRKAEKPPDAPKKEQSRKYAKVDESVDKLLQSHLPVDVACETDGDNGRWRLTHRAPRARQQKSFSWTMAGAGPAAAAALKEAFKPDATEKLVKKWQGLPPPERKPEDRWQGPAAEPARSSTEL